MPLAQLETRAITLIHLKVIKSRELIFGLAIIMMDRPLLERLRILGLPSMSNIPQGKYLLNIFASVMDSSGQLRSRVMAIAFYMGDKNHNQSKIPNSDATEKVIILPSQVSGGDE